MKKDQVPEEKYQYNITLTETKFTYQTILRKNQGQKHSLQLQSVCVQQLIEFTLEVSHPGSELKLIQWHLLI